MTPTPAQVERARLVSWARAQAQCLGCTTEEILAELEPHEARAWIAAPTARAWQDRQETAPSQPLEPAPQGMTPDDFPY